MRKAEVERTYPADARLDKGSARVEISPRKHGTPSYRVVTIPENARAMLEQCLKRGIWMPQVLLDARGEPKKDRAGKPIEFGTYFNRSQFDKIKEAAGITQYGARRKRHGRAAIVSTVWQDNILRHTGISYLYQKTGDIKEVTRQAGNSSDTSFKHYLRLPETGACEFFYAILAAAL